MRSLFFGILLTAAMAFAGMIPASAGEARLVEEPSSWVPQQWAFQHEPTFDQIFDEILPAAQAKAVMALGNCEIFNDTCSMIIAASIPVDMTQYMVCIDEDEQCYGPMFKADVMEMLVAYQDVVLTVWDETQPEFWEASANLLPPVPLELAPSPLYDGSTIFVATR